MQRGDNPYLDQLEKEERGQRARAAAENAVQSFQPAQHARAEALSRETGLPMDTAYRRLPEAEAMARARRNGDLAEKNPALAAIIDRRPGFAANASDDFETIDRLTAGEIFKPVPVPKLSTNYGFRQASEDYQRDQDYRTVRVDRFVRDAMARPPQVEQGMLADFQRGLAGRLRGFDADQIDAAQEQLRLIDRIESGELADDVSILKASPSFGSMFSGNRSPEYLSERRRVAQGMLGENVAEFQRRSDRLLELPQRPEVAAFYESDGLGDALKQFAANPLTIAAGIVGESLGARAPDIPLIFGAGGLGGIRALAGTAGVTSGLTEYATALAGAIQEAGVDVQNPAALSAFMASPEFEEAKRKAATKAIFVGAADAIGARLAGVRLRPSLAGNLAAQTGVQATAGAAGEAFGSLASGQEVNAAAVLAEMIGEIPGALVDVGAASLGVARQEAQGAEQADFALKAAKSLDDAAKLVAQSEYAKRDPEGFAQAMTEQVEADGGTAQVWIDGKALGDALHQSGVPLAELPESIRDQVVEAINTGGDVVLPIGDYLTQIQTQDYAPLIDPHVRTQEDGVTPTEANAYFEGQAARMSEQARKIIERAAKTQEDRADAETVRERVFGMLQTAGRWSESVNRDYSTIAEAYYVATAQRMGMTASELFAQYPLEQVLAQLPGRGVRGVRFDQSPAYRIAVANDRLLLDGVDVGMAEVIPKTRAARGGNGIEIARLYIDPKYQRQGIGGALVDNLFLQHSDAEFIDVYPSGPSEPFWLRQGPVDMDAEGYFRITRESRASRTQPTRGLGQTGALFQQDGADPNILYQQGGNKALQDATARWKSALGKVSKNRLDYTPTLVTPTVLRALGVKQKTLALPTRVLMQIHAKHPDVPLEVFENLPALLADPVAIYPHKDGGWRVIIDAVTARGEPIAVGVGERIQTITPINDEAGQSGAQRVESAWNRAVGQRGAKLYLRNDKAPDKSGASVVVPSATIALQHSPTSAASIFTKEKLVKQFGDAFYQPDGGDTARGAYLPDSASIVLLKNADLSTFLHELGHHFLELNYAIASRPDAPTELKADFEATMRWFGLKDSRDWDVMTFEERVPYHEQFARGFEAYLRSGEAPSVELQSVFSKFRDWLVKIYQRLTDLDVKLSPEIAGVFDRMLASDAAIADMEEVRGYAPLFESAEQAGMTAEQFAAWQRGYQDASKEAVAQMDARAIKDMRWTRNALAREETRLRVEAKVIRRETEKEIRREVMSQPVYRAWSWLTARESANADPKVDAAENKAAREREKADREQLRIDIAAGRKKDPKLAVNEESDTILTAIAKLGGLDRAKLESEWGFDRKTKLQSGLFGVPVVRKPGDGRSIDDMAGVLAQYGYLPTDENGQYELNDFEEAFRRASMGEEVYSTFADFEGMAREGEQAPAGQSVDELEQRLGGRLDTERVQFYVGEDGGRVLSARGMTRAGALDPDAVAAMMGYESGSEMLNDLVEARDPREVIDELADARMLQEHGDLVSEDAVRRAAEESIHNQARARHMANTLEALENATAPRTPGQNAPGRVLLRAARMTADAMIGSKRLRDITTARHTRAEAAASRRTREALKSGDVAAAANEQRTALLNNQLAAASFDALREVERGLKYLKKFGTPAAYKRIHADYTDQIDTLLERYDLRKGQSARKIDQRRSLAEWVESQESIGLDPDIPPKLLREAGLVSYRDLSMTDFRDLVTTIQQIEQLGKLKNKLLAVGKGREYKRIRDEIAASIEANRNGRQADNLPAHTALERASKVVRVFDALHLKAAAIARMMDGGQDGGPVWEYLIRPANERGDWETVMRAEATEGMAAILDPVFDMSKMGGAGTHFKSIGRALNKAEVVGLALNMGNLGNIQRLLGGGDGPGKPWTMAQIQPVLASLTAREWQAVQGVWDFMERYRPLIAAKERRVNGKEPDWVEPQALTVTTADGQTITLRGGYYPIKYDRNRSGGAAKTDEKAELQELGSGYTSATTRRSFTKARVEELSGRPLLLDVSTVFTALNEVIHDLAWHEYLIDANRLLDSTTLDALIRDAYGAETMDALRSWLKDIAGGDRGSGGFLSAIRKNVSAAALGYNFMSAAIQPIGLTQSWQRIGGAYLARGMARYFANPLASTRAAHAASTMMENRNRTRFRELNELANTIRSGMTRIEKIRLNAYVFIRTMQLPIDVMTWHGANMKALNEGRSEADAVALADQAVIDSQSSGMLKDMSAIERGRGSFSQQTGNDGIKLFGSFYSFMSSTYNLARVAYGTKRSAGQRAADTLLLLTLPAIMTMLLRDLLKPGDDDDDEDETLEDFAKKAVAAQVDYLFGTMVFVREFSGAAKSLMGVGEWYDARYGGPAGLRLIGEAGKLGSETGDILFGDGEFDDGFRKAAISVAGLATGLPAVQVNNTITGAQALAEDETDNPAALLFGYSSQ